jgi:hypothetical protein
MNNEKLQELLKNAETPYGNELVEILEEDFGAEFIDNRIEYDDRGFFDKNILKVGDVYVRVVHRHNNIGYKDFDYSASFAQIVERKEEVITLITYV